MCDCPKMGDDGYGSDAVAVDVCPRWRKRRDRSCRSFTSCISPRLVFSRWFNGGNSRAGKIEMPKVGENFGINRRRIEGSVDFGLSHSLAVEKSEDIGKEASFNVGVGFGLMFLIVASRNELNKIVNLQRQMQVLLKNFVSEFQKKQEKALCSDSTMSLSFPNPSEVQKSSYVGKPVSSQYIPSQSFESPEVSFSSGLIGRENGRGMDQIGDELEAELDRLELHINTDFYSKFPKQQHSEINVEESAPEMSLTTSFEDLSKQPYQLMMNYQDHFCGIDPFELERRLHQVLEARQQEEINQLIHQLELKETELSWWKDTVRLISQHSKEPVCGSEPKF